MVKHKVYRRYQKAAARLSNTERELHTVRTLLDGVDDLLDNDGYDLDIDGINEVYTKCAEIIEEHNHALIEYQVCDHNIQYAFPMDLGIILSQRELMLKIMRCVQNTEAWDREAIAAMARRFLKDSGVE